MNLLTEKAFEFSKTGTFSYSDVLVWLGEGWTVIGTLGGARA